MVKKEKKTIEKKDIAKAYQQYVKQFTPKPTYVMNGLRAFFCGRQKDTEEGSNNLLSFNSGGNCCL